MPDEQTRAVIAALMDRHGRTFSEELGINLARGTPAHLFQWLCAALLMSARIPAQTAMRAAAAIRAAGWTTAKRLDRSDWQDRVRALDAAGYVRFDESAARMLGETAQLMLAKYGGDLRRLRARAGQDPVAEKRLLTEFKGIGDLGADIFLREVQLIWSELYPFADGRALDTARRLGLPGTAGDLAALVPRQAFPRLVAALVRAALEQDIEEIRQMGI